MSALINDPGFQRQIMQLRKNPRMIAELVIQAAGDENRARALVARYAGLDEKIISLLGAGEFPPRLLHSVPRDEP